MPLVDDTPSGCPLCGRANCTSEHYEALDPRRPIPRKEGEGWDPDDPSSPDYKGEKPKRDKMVRGPKRDKAVRPDRSKGRVRTGPPAPQEPPSAPPG